MLKNRLCYLLILVCTSVFLVCFNGYYSTFVFILSLVLPVLSVALSLPGMLTLSMSVSTPDEPQPARVAKSQQVTLHISAKTRWLLPSGRARVVLTIYNSFTGDRRTERLEFSPSCRPQIIEHTLSSITCGAISCRLSKARAYDLLGLFWLPVRRRSNGGCSLIVQPTVYAPSLGLSPHRSPDSEGERYSPHRPGYDPTELFGLRDYRPGDKLSRIDWKLSQKSGSLLVKDGSLPVTDQILLLCDLSGTGLEADAAMDAMATLSDYLMVNEAEYIVGFSQEGGFRFIGVTRPEEGYLALEQVLLHTDRGPLPIEAPEHPAGVSRVAYICPQPENATIVMLQELYPGARITLMHLRPIDSHLELPPEVYALRLRPGHLGEDMDCLLL